MYKIQDNIFYKIQKDKNIFNINKNNKLSLISINDFYEYPSNVRSFALAQDINIEGNFPGHRTIPFSNSELLDLIQEIINPFGEIIDRHIHSNGLCIHDDCHCYNGAFFLNTSHSRLPWIHNDHNFYTAIIYLSPNAPEISGTSIFKPICQNEDMSHFSFDKTKCIEIDRLGNIFNRLIIFDASNYHYPNNYFGIDKEDGRLTQVIWFNIKPKHHDENSFIKDNNIHVYKDTIIKSSYPCRLDTTHNCDFIVIDNFYENPLNVREFALSQKFDTTGNFPGARTKSLSINDIFKKIQGYIYQYSSNNIYINGYSAFQYTTSQHQSWVHIDNNNEWAGIIYLTPDAPVTSGTTFYEFYDKYASQDLMNKYSKDMTKWKEIDIVGNIFNRLILFNSKRYHMSRDYFGTDINNGRLFQVFFI